MQATVVQESSQHCYNVEERRVEGHDGLVRVGQAVVNTDDTEYQRAVARRQAAVERARAEAERDKRIESLEEQNKLLSGKLDKILEMLECRSKPEKTS